MPILAKLPKYLSVEEYFELEEAAEVRHEYFNGELLPMAGTTTIHNDIVDNVKRMVKDFFRPKGCRVFSENIKVEAIKDFYYPYPDVMLTCDERDSKAIYVVAHPALLVEVWSKSSYQRDHEFKWRRYKKIPSLQYYVLVSQYEHFVEVYSRMGDTQFWRYQTFENPEDVIQFDKLNFSITVGKIYEDVTFLPDPTMEIVED